MLLGAIEPYPGHHTHRGAFVTVLIAAAIGLASCGPTPDAAMSGVVSDIPTQDGVCSEWSGLMTENACALQCCDKHDRCYARYGCNSLSWFAGSEDCARCNEKLLECFSDPCDLLSSALESREGAPCRSSRDCGSGLLCEDYDCDGRGECAQARSGRPHECCTLPLDCESALCLGGRCVDNPWLD